MSGNNIFCNMNSFLSNRVKSCYEILEIYEQDFIKIEDIKTYLKITSSDDDIIIKQFLHTSIESCENYSGVSLFPRKIKYSLHEFRSNIIYLPNNPIKVIAKVEVLSDKKTTELDLNLINLNLKDGILSLKDYLYYNEIEVLYISGFKDNNLIPRSLIQGIMTHVSQMYDFGAFKIVSEDLQKLYQPYKKVRI